MCEGKQAQGLEHEQANIVTAEDIPATCKCSVTCNRSPAATKPGCRGGLHGHVQQRVSSEDWTLNIHSVSSGMKHQ